MSTMNISLPDSLKAFVDEQVDQRGFGTSSEYVRELIRRDQDRVYLRDLLLAGASSPPTAAVDDKYFDGLRERVRDRVHDRVHQRVPDKTHGNVKATGATGRKR